MHRALVHLVFAAFMLLGVPSTLFAAPTDGVPEVVTVEQDDCCPDTDPTDEADCCDFDFGGCCAGATTALPASASSGEAARSHGSDILTPIPPHLMRPRDNGPPPTPPPIA